ncbi:MAG: twitching motility protein PilT [Lachnospiraceae bacterium]|nr:twitching motility protein PilT [Lachnospiraceae bacterium]
MVRIICGEKGKGKTKIMLQKANDAVGETDGSIVYLDKNSKHMYELDNGIRLVDVSEYPISGLDGIVGFICGLLSGNHDIQIVFVDSFLTVSNLDIGGIEKAIAPLKQISDEVDLVLSISLDEAQIPGSLKEYIEVAL